MEPPIVGKRYKVTHERRGTFVGRCISGRGKFWEFKVEAQVKGMQRVWEIGDVMAVGVGMVTELDEIPLDARGGP